MNNIKKNDPELKLDYNYYWYQALGFGSNPRLEFWRTINYYYIDCYDFDRGFYVIEANRSGDFSGGIRYSSYLIVPWGKNRYKAFQFLWQWRVKAESDRLICYLNNINLIDYHKFYQYYVGLKKQDVKEYLWDANPLSPKGITELSISYFHKDTIESYMNMEYGNRELTNKMYDLLNGDSN
jgi:hypothetical protein